MKNNMRKALLLISFLTLTLISLSQKEGYKPFKFVIIKPDTAIVDSSLSQFIDTIEQSFIKSYYYSIKQLQEMLEPSDIEYPEELNIEEVREHTKKSLEFALKMEDEIKKFKYYHLVSEVTMSVLQFSCREYGASTNPSFEVIESTANSLKKLQFIADSLNADYVLAFDNINTEKTGEEIIMNITTILYSKLEDQIIVKGRTKSDSENQGSMWTCSNTLNCLFINGVKNSLDSYFDEIDKREFK